ncbi:homeodomain-interacting protein kinase 3 [Hippoglossus stenolepis]|uniref:homeodomain-interacting protein kinase 3 n=1 Tax=Hippoglossus stenolepis TaxID=195615 RepID=UPI001FAF48B2|nr:homeodomain-interacting protein kinase 3 [Hippoglossus stenolepis]
MAPEISLGLPFSEAVDVWGVGCVLAFLYLAQNLFSVECKYQMMKNMVTMLGQPQDHLLRAGKYSEQFFIEEEGEDSPSWRLMTAEEYTAVNNVETEEEEGFIELPNSLNGLIHIHPKLAEMEDRMAFVSLLEGLLHLDGDERISPRQALELPFISMSHLREDVHSRDYLTTSQEAMRVCPTEDSVHCSTSDSGYSGSMDEVSWDSVEALDFTSATSELSWCSDLTINSRDTSVWSSIGDDDTREEVSCRSDKAAAAATASSGGKRTLLRRIRKFFSRLTSCCRPKPED